MGANAVPLIVDDRPKSGLSMLARLAISRLIFAASCGVTGGCGPRLMLGTLPSLTVRGISFWVTGGAVVAGGTLAIVSPSPACAPINPRTHVVRVRSEGDRGGELGAGLLGHGFPLPERLAREVAVPEPDCFDTGTGGDMAGDAHTVRLKSVADGVHSDTRVFALVGRRELQRLLVGVRLCRGPERGGGGVQLLQRGEGERPLVLTLVAKRVVERREHG